MRECTAEFVETLAADLSRQLQHSVLLALEHIVFLALEHVVLLPFEHIILLALEHIVTVQNGVNLTLEHRVLVVLQSGRNYSSGRDVRNAPMALFETLTVLSYHASGLRQGRHRGRSDEEGEDGANDTGDEELHGGQGWSVPRR